ncbi:MAG TPA: hypothetical protein VF651_08085 [Gammaproteobacteria bacterium]
MNLRVASMAALLLAAPLALSADTGWVTFAPDNAGFSAKFPATPEPQVTHQKDVDTTVWLAKSADGNFMVLMSTTDYWQHVDAVEEMRLDQENFLKAVGGAADSSHPDPFPGPKGRKKPLPSIVFDFHIGDQWTGRSRVIVDGDTAFQSAVLWKKGYDGGSAVLEAFEASFKMVPRKRPAAQAPLEN